MAKKVTKVRKTRKKVKKLKKLKIRKNHGRFQYRNLRSGYRPFCWVPSLQF